MQSQELKQLVVSADIVPAALLSVRRDRPDPAHFIGAGKVEELKTEAAAANAGLVIFDVALSPAQQRNLEQTLGLWVLDRTALILYIFSQRAQSREGKLQVELAQLQHLSTRLVRGWSHLERQRGGLGKTGGPGEKQIEIDRRLIGVQVRRLRERLKQSRKAAAHTPPCTVAQRRRLDFAGGLHQRRQIDAVQCADAGGGVCGRPAVCDARYHRAQVPSWREWR